MKTTRKRTHPIARNLLHKHQQITTIPIPITPLLLRDRKFHPREHLSQRDRNDTLVFCRDGTGVRGYLGVEGLGGGEGGGEGGVEGGDLGDITEGVSVLQHS